VFTFKLTRPLNFIINLFVTPAQDSFGQCELGFDGRFRPLFVDCLGHGVTQKLFSTLVNNFGRQSPTLCLVNQANRFQPAL
jgi:hypothetical protein